MKILMIHNEYAAVSGEEIQFYHIADILRTNKHEVQLYTRSSVGIEKKTFGKIKSFFTGIYNPVSRRKIGKLMETLKPDIVFVQNLFPLISPSILPVIRKAEVPIVMLVSNYRLMCPNGLHLSHGNLCESCLYQSEFCCLLKNCEENIFKSAGYALRSMIARLMGFYKISINAYICASAFLRKRMIDAGFERQRIHVIPNTVPGVDITEAKLSHQNGAYVAFVGRISREKGVNVLFDAARMCPDIPFKLAGRVNQSFRLPESLPPNVELVGFLNGDALSDLYAGARIFVSTSLCFETFGISVAEAMLHAKPVIVSRIGVFPEFVQDGITGLLSEPGNIEELTKKIRYLWGHPELCHKMGDAGRERALKEYSPSIFYERLMTVFNILSQ
jgi:glycosyltransferase involved in cell wall biosynthesis